MIRPIVRIHNSETNEVIDREMNDVEFTKHNQLLETYAIATAEASAKAEARAALLAQLGITEEQAKLLLGGN